MGEGKQGLTVRAAGPPPVPLARLLRRHLTPKLTLAIVLWRMEAWGGAPLAVALVATLGRWPGALVMAAVVAALTVISLYLLEGEPSLSLLREWLAERPWLARWLSRPRWQVWLLDVPVMLLVAGPFWRAVLLHLLQMERRSAYAIGLLGALPGALLWTGLVAGSVWEQLVWPVLRSLL